MVYHTVSWQHCQMLELFIHYHMAINSVLMSNLVDGNQCWGFESSCKWCCFTALVCPFISKTPCYIPVDLNPQQHHCGNFASSWCQCSFIDTSVCFKVCLLHAPFRPAVWHHGFWTLHQRVRFWICVLPRGWKQHILQPAWKTKGNLIYFVILCQSGYHPYAAQYLYVTYLDHWFGMSFIN